MNAMKRWMNLAHTEEQIELAELAGTSRGYLYHIASGDRVPSVDLAARIEVASRTLHKKSRKRLPKIMRNEICAICSECFYVNKCSTISYKDKDRD